MIIKNRKLACLAACLCFRNDTAKLLSFSLRAKYFKVAYVIFPIFIDLSQIFELSLHSVLHF